ncbi:MAG: 4-(cytidine 5'-diphospho)-2-C-methyl-D-erythritol kinase, partial [Lachnospiraceae bacterium]|nr:4-(cytidine 5'-diphospho)-2-C-methyl-D-erythritol kinase [Lachnospiraceae bacterium]
RDNGYHDVRMVMQQIGLSDEITIERTGTGACGQELSEGIIVETNSGELPLNEDNLAYKAARIIMDECGIDDGIRIYIDKHIPIAAGLAGGSTDAAAVLKGMNEIFELGLAGLKLRELGVRIGADVPYCIMGGTALAEGIGEVLTELEPMPECTILIAKPGISVSTGYVYTAYDGLEQKLHPDVDAMAASLKAGDLSSIAKLLGNSLEGVTQEEYPVIKQIKQIMLGNGTLGALMSGSGPTVFGLFDDRDRADEAMKKIRSEKIAADVMLTEPVN